MSKAAYMSGCLSGTFSRDADGAARAVAKRLGVELVDFDWGCCGGSSASITGPQVERLTSLRNLCRAGETGATELATGCMGCLRQLEATAHTLPGAAGMPVQPDVDSAVAAQESGARGVQVAGMHEILLEALLSEPRPAIQRPLEGLKVATYYGCRAFSDGAGAPRGGPFGRALEDGVRQLGATPVEWTARGECNGGHLTLARGDIVEERTTLINHEAREAGADCIVVVCYLCRFNLTQRPMEDPLPVLDWPQLVGVALGLPVSELGLSLIDPARRLLAGRKLI